MVSASMAAADSLSFRLVRLCFPSGATSRTREIISSPIAPLDIDHFESTHGGALNGKCQVFQRVAFAGQIVIDGRICLFPPAEADLESFQLINVKAICGQSS